MARVFSTAVGLQVDENRAKWDDKGKCISLFYLIAQQQMEQLREAIFYPRDQNIEDEAIHVVATMQEIFDRV